MKESHGSFWMKESHGSFWMKEVTGALLDGDGSGGEPALDIRSRTLSVLSVPARPRRRLTTIKRPVTGRPSPATFRPGPGGRQLSREAGDQP